MPYLQQIESQQNRRMAITVPILCYKDFFAEEVDLVLNLEHGV